jgi:hypothetical protein
MVEEGEDISAFEDFTIEDAGGQKAAPAPPKEEASKPSEPSGAQPSPAAEPAPVPEETGPSGGRLQPAIERVRNASAAAVNLAVELGVKLSGIKGTGTGGQITVDDVKKAASGGVSAPAGTPAASYVDTPITSMRKTIASRLTESVTQNPHYFVSATVSVSKLLKLRQALNASADGKYKLSVNDFLIKACAVACKKVPTVNSSWRDGFIRQFNNVDVSVRLQSIPISLQPTNKLSTGCRSHSCWPRDPNCQVSRDPWSRINLRPSQGPWKACPGWQAQARRIPGWNFHYFQHGHEPRHRPLHCCHQPSSSWYPCRRHDQEGRDASRDRRRDAGRVGRSNRCHRII